MSSDPLPEAHGQQHSTEYTTLSVAMTTNHNHLLGQSSYICCPPPFRRKAEGHSYWLSVFPSFRPSFRLSVPLKYYAPCVRNSSYSFMPIHLKLYRCFCHGLKICMWFGYCPEIIFCHFFRSLNLHYCINSH